MKLLKTIVAIGSLGVLLTGCATAPVEKGYDNSASYALNVWRASGMDGIMKDTKVPSSKVGSAFDSGTGRLLGIYSDTGLAKFGGLDAGIANAAGLFVSLFEPEKPPFRDSFFYWEQYKEGESELDARKRVVDTLKNITSDVLKDEGYEVVTSGVVSNSNYLLYITKFSGKHPDCVKYNHKGEDTSSCSLSVMLPKMNEKPGYGPKILGLNESKYWYQSPKDISRGQIEIRYWKSGETKNTKDYDRFLSGFNSQAIYSKISKRLPKNYFLYLAPSNKTYNGEGNKIEFPLVLEKGEAFTFVVSE